MEFLMTYGWAILIVIVALSSLYFLGVFSPKTPNTYFIQAPLLIQDLSIKNNGILFKMTSSLIKEAKIIDVEINGQSCGSLNGFLYNTQINGEAYTGCALDLGDYNKISGILNVIYISKSGLNHVLTGQYSGSIEGGSISEIIEQNNNGIFHLYDNNLVFGWDGESVIDYIGNRVATENGGVNVGGVSGYLGRGTNFDGVNDALNIGIGSDYFPLPLFSMCTWVKSSGVAPGMSTVGIIGFTYGLRFNLLDNGRFYTMVEGGNWESVPGNLYDNNFHYLCLTYNGTNRNMYVDGVNKLSVAHSWSGTTSWPGNSVNIGRDNNNANQFFRGTIDEFHVWNRTLSDAEVSNLHNSYL